MVVVGGWDEVLGIFKYYKRRGKDYYHFYIHQNLREPPHNSEPWASPLRLHPILKIFSDAHLKMQPEMSQQKKLPDIKLRDAVQNVSETLGMKVKLYPLTMLLLFECDISRIRVQARFHKLELKMHSTYVP